MSKRDPWKSLLRSILVAQDNMRRRVKEDRRVATEQALAYLATLEPEEARRLLEEHLAD